MRERRGTTRAAPRGCGSRLSARTLERWARATPVGRPSCGQASPSRSDGRPEVGYARGGRNLGRWAKAGTARTRDRRRASQPTTRGGSAPLLLLSKADGETQDATHADPEWHARCGGRAGGHAHAVAALAARLGRARPPTARPQRRPGGRAPAHRASGAFRPRAAGARSARDCRQRRDLAALGARRALDDPERRPRPHGDRDAKHPRPRLDAPEHRGPGLGRPDRLRTGRPQTRHRDRQLALAQARRAVQQSLPRDEPRLLRRRAAGAARRSRRRRRRHQLLDQRNAPPDSSGGSSTRATSTRRRSSLSSTPCT